MFKDYVKFSLEGMKKRKLRSLLTMIGIFIGIAAVISIISLGQGLENSIEEQFQKIGTDKIFVTPGAGFGVGGTTETKLTEHDKKVIEKVRGVKEVGALTFGFADVNFKGRTELLPINGLPVDSDELDTVLEAFSIEAVKGRDLKSGDNFKVVVGHRHAERDVIWGKKVGLRDTLEIEGQEFKVVGVMNEIGNPPDDSNLYIPIDAAKEIFGLEEDEFDFIILKSEKGFEPSEVALRIEEEMREDRGLDEGEEDFQVQTFESAVATFTNIFAIVQAVLIGIAAISLLVGGIGIMNTMYMSTLERTKEIGVMKAIGAKNSHILQIFLIESGIYGLIGGAIGIFIGIGIAKSVEFIAKNLIGSDLIRAHISLPLILGALAFSFVVGTLSGIVPSYKASKLNPVTALKYE